MIIQTIELMHYKKICPKKIKNNLEKFNLIMKKEK